MLEADFDYFMGRADSITKDQPIGYTHTRNGKACGCGKLDIFIKEEKGVILQAAFSGGISIPNQVLMNDICCRIEGLKAIDAIRMNFAGELAYKLPTSYQKCFQRFIIHTLVFLLRDVIENSSSNNTDTKD